MSSKNLHKINLAEYIRQSRLERNWSQAQLANAIGVTPMTVSRWENGETFPDQTNLMQLKNLFNIPDVFQEEHQTNITMNIYVCLNDETPLWNQLLSLLPPQQKEEFY